MNEIFHALKMQFVAIRSQADAAIALLNSISESQEDDEIDIDDDFPNLPPVFSSGPSDQE